MADRRDALGALATQVSACRACPRLVAWREQVAAEKRASFADQEYWGRPVPGFGDPDAELLVVGLAPAAHGGNRTGRVFTGDRSGDWLYRALHRTGYANQPSSTHRDDGLTLRGCYVAAAVRCAPPANKPSPQERDACRPYLRRELDLLTEARVVVVLGAFAYEVIARELGMGRRPKFAHLAEAHGAWNGRPLAVVCSFHPSQQNTFTGRLTEEMLESVFVRARSLAATVVRHPLT